MNRMDMRLNSGLTTGVLALLLVFVPEGVAQTQLPEHQGVGQGSPLREFVSRLQSALEHGDRDKVAAMTRFPVQVGETRETSDPEAFKRAHSATMLDETSYIARFEEIWNRPTIRAVANDSSDHFSSSGDHFVFGCGEVWFDRTKEDQFKIVGFDISRFRGAGMSIQDCYSVREFVTQLQIAIAHDNRSEIAEMLKYPVRYHGQHKTMIIRSSHELLRNYDIVFSARLRRVVAEQKIWNLNSQRYGVPIGYGSIWIYAPLKKGDFKINSIFEPADPAE
jgi:hypothetical protein